MIKENKQDIILTDCEPEEVEDLVKGINDAMGIDLKIYAHVANGSHTKIYNLYRYLVYALFPVKFFIHRKKYRYIICWQQFYALFFCLYSRIFRTKKENFIVACNYTYKPKKKIEKIYLNYFKNNSQSKYLDKIHVSSASYAENCSREFNIPISKFIVAPFGLEDSFSKWKKSKVEYSSYALAIGRSNRDFDFLIDAWRNVEETFKLLIISDTYKPKSQLPSHVIHRKDITGDLQFPYIANCIMMIIPIQDGSICSGDTVLLKAMSFSKPLIVTSPSVLAEMYVDDRVNGVLVEKEPVLFASTIMNLFNNPDKMKKIGINARNKYEKEYSRYQMGYRIGETIRKNHVMDTERI